VGDGGAGVDGAGDGMGGAAGYGVGGGAGNGMGSDGGDDADIGSGGATKVLLMEVDNDEVAGCSLSGFVEKNFLY